MLTPEHHLTFLDFSERGAHEKCVSGVNIILLLNQLIRKMKTFFLRGQDLFLESGIL